MSFPYSGYFSLSFCGLLNYKDHLLGSPLTTLPPAICYLCTITNTPFASITCNVGKEKQHLFQGYFHHGHLFYSTSLINCWFLQISIIGDLFAIKNQFYLSRKNLFGVFQWGLVRQQIC